MSDLEPSETSVDKMSVDKTSPTFDFRHKMLHSPSSSGNFSIDNLLKLEQKNLPKKEGQNSPNEKSTRLNDLSTNGEMPNVRLAMSPDGLPITTMSQGKKNLN